MHPAGYGMTPNKFIPLNDREPGEIAPIALQQLKRYQLAAETWPIQAVARREQWYDNSGKLFEGCLRRCMICRLCKENLWFPCDPEGNDFTYSDEDIKTLTVAHIRQCHEKDIDES